jgi:hypothetical protein
MKKLIWLVLFASCLFCGNRLSAQLIFGNPTAVINYLRGEWKWVYSHGGLFGQTYDSSKVGYSVRYIFDFKQGSADSASYSCFKNDTLVGQGIAGFYFPNDSYSLYKDWAFYYLDGRLINTSGYGLIIHKVSNDTLFFRDHGSDGFNHQFVRIGTMDATSQELRRNQPLAYPNPCRSYFRVNLGNHAGPATLTLTNLAGQTVKEDSYLGGEVNMAGLPPGVYILRLKTRGHESREKLIIR